LLRALLKELSYSARIVFRNDRIYLHLSVPIELYLKYFSKGSARGKLIAGFDLNSDRINMIIADNQGIIRGVKTEWFPEVTSHGYPGNKADALRLRALAKLLDYAFHHGVGTVLFEDLERIKKRRYTKSRKANRKISRFAKRKLLDHAIVMSMKHGFKVYLANPAYTTKIGEKIGRELGLDRHTASAYALILKYLGITKTMKSTQRSRKSSVTITH